MTRPSSEIICENLQKNFATFPTEDAYRKANKSCEKTAAKATADGVLEGSKDVISTAPPKIGNIFSAKIWKENAVDETNKCEHAQSKISLTAGGSDDTVQIGKTVFGIWHQQLAPETFENLEHQRYDGKIALTDESVIDDVFEHSTSKELVMPGAFVNGQDGSFIGSRDVVFGSVRMKWEEPGYSDEKTLLKKGNEINTGRIQDSRLDIVQKELPLGKDCNKNSSLNSEPQLLNSEDKN